MTKTQEKKKQLTNWEPKRKKRKRKSKTWASLNQHATQILTRAPGTGSGPVA